VRVSPKISSPQPSHILRLSSQRITNARLIRDQVIAEFHTSTPDGSFKFQEVPSYLALHNLSLPEITSESDSESTSQPTSPTSASHQYSIPTHRHSLPLTSTHSSNNISPTKTILAAFGGQQRKTLCTTSCYPMP
jgi:hypothetical protein